jgi:hypothetical protein
MKATLVLALGLAAVAASAQTIDPQRGADPAVDYRSLAALGPWDDRNYSLTASDLALLAPNEAELNVKIPAFYRVQLRRERPEMLREGPVQYPHSAAPMFRTLYGGYLVEGVLYRSVVRDQATKQWRVDLSRPWVSQKEWTQAALLDGEARVTNPTGAAESAVAINPVNPSLVIAGSNGPAGGQNMHFSTDAGATWNAAAALPLGGTCCDPTVAWSSDGTKAYTATLGSAVFFYRSGDNGQTWTDLNNEPPGNPGNDPRRELGSGVDKEYLHVDTHPTSPFLDRIYLSWHQSNVLRIARSADFGHTWSTVVHSNASDMRGIGSDITTDKNGHVYHFWPTFNSQKIKVLKSTDGGATFDAGTDVASTQGSFIFPVPSMETREVFIYASADADRTNGPFANSIYVAWTDSTGATGSNPTNNHARIQVARSRDGGATWDVSTPHATVDANSVDRYHQWLAVGPDGAVHVVFYDTEGDATRNSVHLNWSVSTDGGVNWSTPAALTTVRSSDIVDSFEFGDYNGLDVVGNQLIAIFTDNRNEAGGGGESVDVYAAGTFTAGGIFNDGFESGDATAWSATVP